MCVMPPAQAVRMRTGKGDGRVVVKATEEVNIEAGASAETQHAVEKLFDQSSATLFMQQGLYRVCEMAQNGGLKGADGGLDTDRYQELVDKILDATERMITSRQQAQDLRTVESVARALEELEHDALQRLPMAEDVAARDATPNTQDLKKGRGTELEQTVDRCGAATVVFQAKGGNVPVKSGESAGFNVTSPRFGWLCGASQEFTTCETDTNYVEVYRSGSDREMQISCRKR